MPSPGSLALARWGYDRGVLLLVIVLVLSTKTSDLRMGEDGAQHSKSSSKLQLLLLFLLEGLSSWAFKTRQFHEPRTNDSEP